MRHLAETTRNHESQQYSYNQWDADKIYGCICDLGYQGWYIMLLLRIVSATRLPNTHHYQVSTVHSESALVEMIH
jgi:hypothetical protein